MIEKKITVKRYQELEEVLGTGTIQEPIQSPFDFIKLGSKGLPANALEHFNAYFDLSKNYTAHLLNLSEPTLYRLLKSGERLKKNNSIQLLEVADLFLYGIEVFENKENFFKWLNLSNVALGGLEPQELVEVPGGVSKVRDLLGRIEHGVYS